MQVWLRSTQISSLSKPSFLLLPTAIHPLPFTLKVEMQLKTYHMRIFLGPQQKVLSKSPIIFTAAARRALVVIMSKCLSVILSFCLVTFSRPLIGQKSYRRGGH